MEPIWDLFAGRIRRASPRPEEPEVMVAVRFPDEEVSVVPAATLTPKSLAMLMRHGCRLSLIPVGRETFALN